MVDIANRQVSAAPQAQSAERKPLPRWVITLASISILLILWGNIRPPHQSCIRVLSVRDSRRILGTGGQRPIVVGALRIPAALFAWLRPVAILIGVPLGLLIGGSRVAEAALGIYVTAGYAMPLVALVPLLILWLGLGFAVKVSVVFPGWLCSRSAS